MLMQRAILSFMAALLAASSAQAQACPRYEVAGVIVNPNCGGSSAESPESINNHNEVTGWYACNGGGERPFLWREGVFTALNDIAGASEAYAFSIDSSSRMTGWASIDSEATPVRLYPDGSWEAVAPDHAGWTRNANDRSDVVGRLLSNGHAFAIIDGGVIDFGEALGEHIGVAMAINNGRTVVGEVYYAGRTSSSAFSWSKGSLRDLGAEAGDISSSARVLNEAGLIAGITIGPHDRYGTETRARLWTASSVQDLGMVPGYHRASPTDMNESATIVGRCWGGEGGSTGYSTGFLWRSGVMYDVQDLLAPHEEIRLVIGVEGINDNGWLVGDAIVWNTGAFVGVVLRPIPPIPGDTTCEGRVDWTDLLRVLSSWGPCVNCIADFDGSGAVDSADLEQTLIHWSGP